MKRVSILNCFNPSAEDKDAAGFWINIDGKIFSYQALRELNKTILAPYQNDFFLHQNSISLFLPLNQDNPKETLLTFFKLLLLQ